MKKVFLLNFSESFSSDLSNYLREESVDVNIFKAGDLLLDLGNGYSVGPSLVSKNGVQEVTQETTVFMKRRKPFPVYSTYLLQFFNVLGAKVLNEAFLQSEKNAAKQAQYIKLIKNNYRIPRTLMLEHSSLDFFAEYITNKLSFPMVLKGFGSCGRSVWKVNSIEEIKLHLESLSSKSKEVVLLQEFIETSSEEFRALCFGGEIIAVIRRSSKNFLNNHAQGGFVDEVMLSEYEISRCIEAAAVSGLDYVGVDFMRSSEGEMIFLELQTGPSLNVTKIVNPDVVKDMANIIVRKY